MLNGTCNLKSFDYVKENNVRKNDAQKAIENITRINALTQQKEELENEVKVIKKMDFVI